MPNIDIETTQHVKINYEVAGVSERIGAFFIDLLIMIAYGLTVYFILFSVGIANNWVLILLVALPLFFYHLGMEFLLQGQSPGKRALQIKVIEKDGPAASFGDYFLRWIFRLVEISMTSGALAMFTILFNGKGQRLGDLAAGTTVVKVKKMHSLSDTVYQQQERGYTAEFPQVSELSDKDIATINRVLHAYGQYNRDVFKEMIKKTVAAVEKKINIEAPDELTDIEFLRRVLKDYNAIYGQ